MSFTKLNPSIVASTLWVQPADVLRVWVWLTSKADANGDVDASILGLAHQCLISVYRAREIVDWLSSAEADEYRIVSTDRGWRLLNHDAVFPPTSRAAQLASSAWRSIRQLIFERDKFTCVYCGATGVSLQCDHVHPVSRGGTDDPENLATACQRCNASKGAKTLSEWKRA